MQGDDKIPLSIDPPCDDPPPYVVTNDARFQRARKRRQLGEVTVKTFSCKVLVGQRLMFCNASSIEVSDLSIFIETNSLYLSRIGIPYLLYEPHLIANI
jgi:hypothetical protein